MKIIEITTSQNVPLQYELAAVWERAMAIVIDYILIMFLFVALFAIAKGGDNWVINILVIFTVTLYPFLFEIFMNGQTPGKKALSIKVIKLNGTALSISDATARWLVGFIDIYLSAGCIAAFLVNATDKGQRVGDIIANTTVIKLNPKIDMTLASLLSIKTTDNYTSTYPDAAKFSEEDMLIVKEVLQRYKEYNNEAHKEALKLLSDKVAFALEIKTPVKNDVEFLNKVLQDYITLTR
jgi:uncharacterized RDD family membrane protein YckC